MTLHPVLIAVWPTAAARTPEIVQQQRTSATLALSQCAALSGAPEEGWRSDVDDRPISNSGFHWSVSHKQHWAAAVVADQPVGIDIEHVRPRREALLDELATSREWDILGDRSWHSFFRLWTAKEAVLKANGRGIGGFSDCLLLSIANLHRMTLGCERSEWPIEHYYLSDHVAAVTCHDAGVHWNVVDEGPFARMKDENGRMNRSVLATT